MIVLRIFSGLCALFFLIILIRTMVIHDKRYKEFIDFCRKEGDSETPTFIGYKEFYGEEYGLRESYTLSSALKMLESKYEKTGKKEYFEYGEFIRKNGWKSILYILYIIVIFICISIAIG